MTHQNLGVSCLTNGETSPHVKFVMTVFVCDTNLHVQGLCLYRDLLSDFARFVVTGTTIGYVRQNAWC